MGITWWTGFGGGVAIASRLVKGQTVKRLPSMVGWEGMFVVRRMLRKGKIRYLLNQTAGNLNARKLAQFTVVLSVHEKTTRTPCSVCEIGRERFTARR